MLQIQINLPLLYYGLHIQIYRLPVIQYNKLVILIHTKFFGEQYLDGDFTLLSRVLLFL